jgi:hypothetical protein
MDHPDDPERKVNISYEYRWSKLKDSFAKGTHKLPLKKLLQDFFNYYMTEYSTKVEFISISHYP